MLERASALADQAEEMVRSISNRNQRAQISLTLAEIAVAGGKIEWAQKLVRSIGRPDQQASMLAALAGTAMEAGNVESAKEGRT